jgi:predicted SAM-dependent methyltransferase
MNLLNLGCGGTRPKEPEWTNLDDLHSQLPLGEGAREDLDKEANYINFDVMSGAIPLPQEAFDGILASHFFEHFDAQMGLRLMIQCRQLLKPGGVLVVSVPDASYFRNVHPQDRKDNWPVLFDTHDPNNTFATFFEAALWFEQHKVLFTEDSLWCYFTMANLKPAATTDHPAMALIQPLLNRRKFSLEMIGTK